MKLKCQVSCCLADDLPVSRLRPRTPDREGVRGTGHSHATSARQCRNVLALTESGSHIKTTPFSLANSSLRPSDLM